MPYINHSRRTGTLEQVIGRHEDGTLLRGEADMYQRIIHDCGLSRLHWHIWYDLSLPISYAGQSEIQIDFLLICEKGAIILEVKGGKIDVVNGYYYYIQGNGRNQKMPITPFEQAHNYKWALLNHNVLNREKILVDYAVAFPHQEMPFTSESKSIDLSSWLWDKCSHDNKNNSFASFCEKILDAARANTSMDKYLPVLEENELEEIVQILSPTIVDKGRYAQSTLAEVLDWLHIQNLDTLKSLERNKRLLIEGGPGTGKTTMAKAYIKMHKALKGLYLCHNILLYAKVKEELIQEDLYNCEVCTYNRYINSLCHTLDSNNNKWNLQKLKKALRHIKHKTYDYIIIDEAQDIADKGIDLLIDKLVSISGDGISTGNYLLFYDIEQGYNSNSRHIEDFVSCYLSHASHFKLNENKRVITNRHIVNIANRLLTLGTNEEFTKYINNLYHDSIPYLRITYVNSNKELSRKFRVAIKQSEDTENTVVLVHSVLKHTMLQSDSIYDLLSDNPNVHILNEDSITTPNKYSIPFTSILKFKGLETHKVILVIPESCKAQDFNNFLFEVYIGFTRAIMELDIIIFSN